MAATTPSKIIHEHEGVFIHSNTEESEEQELIISGFLRIIDKDGEVGVEFKPLEDAVDPSNILCACKDSSSVVEWTQLSADRSQRPAEQQPSYEAEWDVINTVSFKHARKTHTNGEGGANQASERSRWTFTFNLGDLRSIAVKSEGWSHLTFSLKDETTLPTVHFHQGGCDAFLENLRKSAQLSKCPDDECRLLVSCYSKTLSQSFENLLDDTSYGLVQKFKKDPYTTTLGRFSKVTNYIFDAFRGPELEARERGGAPGGPGEEEEEVLGEMVPGLEINQQEEPGFEVVTRVDLGVRPEVHRGQALTVEVWAQNLDAYGRLSSPAHLQQLIFKGGLSHAARKEAWKFLLGYWPWDSSYEDRRSLQRRKTDEYFRMKLQWKSVSDEQEKRNSRLRDYRSLIEKDVNRTDRNTKFYEGLETPGLMLLHDILMTYCMYDFDLGYVQGMSDVLSPILYVMENEVDAFWCFVAFMEKMHENFEEQMQGMKRQLIQLSTLIRLLDLPFWNYLEAQDSGYLYFCFRWLLIRFKREFQFQDVLRLWEVMWTELPCQNFHLLVCCAILDSEKQKIMERSYGFNEILKHINELSMKLDVEEILQMAEGICVQLQRCKDLPHSVSEILGLNSNLGASTLQTSEYGTLESPDSSPKPNRHAQFLPNGHTLRPLAQPGCEVAFIS